MSVRQNIPLLQGKCYQIIVNVKKAIFNIKIESCIILDKLNICKMFRTLDK